MSATDDNAAAAGRPAAKPLDTTWYRRFFTGLFVEVWHQAVPIEHTRNEVDFLERHLQPAPGQRVLDVACGFGRHSLELARRGCRMTGVDVSPDMLGLAQRLAAEAGADVDWRLADVCELKCEAEFDAAFCLGNSFGYTDRDGTRAFLRAVARALKPGARFAFDYGLSAESILPRFTRQEWMPIGDFHFLERNQYHAQESVFETAYTIIRGGVVETSTSLHWVFTVGEVQALLREAGLVPLALHGGCDGQPFELGSPLLVVVTRAA